jgi:hypothetical protein
MYKVGIKSEVHGTIPLVIPPCLEIPPLFLIPSYLLGIPPWRVVRFPSTLVLGCLCTDLPPLFPSPSPFPFLQWFPISNTCPPTPPGLDSQMAPSEDGDEAVGASAPAIASSRVCAISLRLTRIAPLTCLSFSFIDMDGLTWRNDIHDSSLVRSPSPSLLLNRHCATSILSSLWMKTAILLMWVLKAWCPHKMNDSACSNPAAWSLSWCSMTAVDPSYVLD